MKKENNYWVDENNNSWNCELFTEEQAIKNSKTLSNCHDCNNCHDCSDCNNCHDCRNCSNCHDCNSCHDCSDCNNCHDCRNCSDFKLNPQRIYSNLIGSRNSTTRVYWVEDNIQVICGCFIGNLDEFENKVKQTHINSPKYLEEYLYFINKVRNYINN